jgi:hypothetical protein
MHAFLKAFIIRFFATSDLIGLLLLKTATLLHDYNYTLSPLILAYSTTLYFLRKFSYLYAFSPTKMKKTIPITNLFASTRLLESSEYTYVVYMNLRNRAN